MRRNRFLPLLLGLVALRPLAAAGDVKPKATNLEVQRFSVGEGVTLPKELPDFLYALLTEKLRDAKLTIAILGENELPDPPDPAALALEGKLLGARGAWYRGAGEKKLTAEVVLRRGSKDTIFKKELSAGPSVWTRVSYEDENELWSAAALADRIVKEIRDALK
jgi:hypothetical protein